MAILDRWHRPGNMTTTSPCKLASVGVRSRAMDDVIIVTYRRNGDGRLITLELSEKEAGDLAARVAEAKRRVSERVRIPVRRIPR